MADEVILFFRACLLGCCCGLFFDLFRILRLALPHIWLTVFLEDFCYFLVVTLGCLWFILQQNDGVLRGFLIIGVLSGAFLYFFTLSVAVMRLAKWVISLIRRLMRGIWKTILLPVFRPVRRLEALVGSLFQKIKHPVKKMLRKCKSLLKKQANRVYNTEYDVDDASVFVETPGTKEQYRETEKVQEV